MGAKHADGRWRAVWLRRASQGVTILCVANLGALLVGLLVLHAVAEAHWVTAVALYIPQVVYGLPLLLLAPAAAIVRRRHALAVCAVAGVIVAGPAMGFCVPWRRLRPEPQGTHLRVMAWNVRGGGSRLGQIREEIERWDPDVLLLSEAFHFRRATAVELLGDPETDTLSWWTHRVSGADIFLASRLPARNGPTGQLSQGGEWGTLVQGAVEVGGTRVVVLGTHLATPFRGGDVRAPRLSLNDYTARAGNTRQLQAEELAAVISQIQGPLILGGDFNTPPRGRVYATISAGLIDAFSMAGWGWGHSYSDRRPLLRIDYVMCRGLIPVGCWVGSARGSDHRPIIADLVVPQGKSALAR